MNFNRKYAAVLVSGVLALNAIPVTQSFADISTSITPTSTAAAIPIQSNLYTVEKATELAIKASLTFKNADLDRIKLGRQLDDLKRNINDAIFMVKSATQLKDQTDPIIDSITSVNNNITSTDENTALQKEALKDTIRNAFVAINRTEVQLASLDEQVKLNNRLIEIDRKKVKIGYLSRYDLESNFNAYQKVEKTRASLRVSLQKLYINLKTLMGIDAVAPITLDCSFINETPVIPLDHDSGYNKMMSSNMKIAIYRDNLKRSQDFLVGVKDRYPSGDSAIQNADLDVDKNQLTLDDALKSLPYKYETDYEAVLDAYANYNQKLADYKLKSLEAKNGAVRIKLGIISSIAYEMLKTGVNVASKDLSLSKIDYVLAKLTLESTIAGTNQ